VGSATVSMASTIYAGLAIASNSASTISMTFDNVSVTSGGSAPVITSATTATGTVGTAFNYNITANNSPTSFGATGLPAGLSVNTGSGLISGTPTASGNSSANITATNSSGTGSGPLTITIAPAGGGLPSPWVTADVGAVGASGSASYTGGTFTVTGSGADIWGTADELRYVYQSASGDCSVTARVASVQNTSLSAKAGVMIRETLNANSTFAAAYLTPQNLAKFEYRATSGGSAANNNLTATTIPYWVRVTRVGNTFSAYRSTDGSTWSQLGTSVTITMGINVFIGLPVCSHADGTLCTSSFTNVTAVP